MSPGPTFDASRLIAVECRDRTGTADASVVLCAREREHRVVTSDPGDMVALDARRPLITV